MAWQKKNRGTDENDIQVNAGKYIDMAITNALTVLPKATENGESMKGALLSLTISIDQLENICLANKLIEADDPEYKKDIDDFKKNLKEQNEDLQRAMLANFKMRLLMARVFESGIVDLECLI